MKEEKWYYVSAKLLWQNRYTGLAFLLYAAIFGGIFFLYNIEAEAVLYAAGLCALPMGPASRNQPDGQDCQSEQRKRIAGDVEVMLDEMPPPKTLAEEDDQELLRQLKAVYDRNLAAWQNERRESMDYYTTWVHQIKTPISVMRMILQEEDTRENRELLAELFRIEQYVEMALNWMRLGSDSTDFIFQEYELDGIIRQAIRKYAGQFIRNRISVCYEPTQVRVLTDEKWLLFVIEQLLSNAVKYTREGRVTIRVTREKVLQIQDTGIGIAPEDIPRIFEKGFTGYNGRADKKSTGLGLYLSRLTADKLSNRLWAESVPGVGTTFFMDLYREELKAD